MQHGKMDEWILWPLYHGRRYDWGRHLNSPESPFTYILLSVPVSGRILEYFLPGIRPHSCNGQCDRSPWQWSHSQEIQAICYESRNQATMVVLKAGLAPAFKHIVSSLPSGLAKQACAQSRRPSNIRLGFLMAQNSLPWEMAPCTLLDLSALSSFSLNLSNYSASLTDHTRLTQQKGKTAKAEEQVCLCFSYEMTAARTQLLLP